jgi:hypothetical protein
MNRELLKRIYSATCTTFYSLPAEILTEIESELEKPEQKPTAWASKNVIPLRAGKDNHPCILTAFKCEANTVPLFTSPPSKQLIDADMHKTAKLFALEAAELRIERNRLYAALEKALPLLHTGDEIPIEYYSDKPGVLGDALRALKNVSHGIE